jgi:uncharacterized protein
VTQRRALLHAAALVIALGLAAVQPAQAQPAPWPADGGAFSAYPRAWGLARPDPNIDHRRVPNLQTFFRRRGTARPPSSNPSDYAAGDVVTWLLPGNLPHIGLVIDRRSADGVRPLVVHNIGRGPEIEDTLFAFPITGHYRYRGD